jgi:hypothetical protein
MTFLTMPYAVFKNSSFLPAGTRMERMMVLTPSLAFSMNTTSAGSALTYWASEFKTFDSKGRAL